MRRIGRQDRSFRERSVLPGVVVRKREGEIVDRSHQTTTAATAPHIAMRPGRSDTTRNPIARDPIRPRTLRPIEWPATRHAPYLYRRRVGVGIPETPLVERIPRSRAPVR